MFPLENAGIKPDTVERVLAGLFCNYEQAVKAKGYYFGWTPPQKALANDLWPQVMKVKGKVLDFLEAMRFTYAQS